MGSHLLDVGPTAPLTRAVLAVGRRDRILLAVEDNRDDLPVAFVRLPGERTRRVLEAPEVVSVEVPVLENDRAGAYFEAAVDNTRAGGRGVTRDGCQAVRGRAATVVEPPTVALHGQAGRWKIGGMVEPVVAELLQVGVGEEVVDRRRHERLRRVELGDWPA